MKEIGALIKKHFVLIICIALAIATLVAGIWFLRNPNTPAKSNDNSQTSESTGDLDTGLGDMDSDNTSSILPDGNTSSGDIKPIVPDQKDESATDKTPSDSGGASQGGQQSNILDVSGSITANPFK